MRNKLHIYSQFVVRQSTGSLCSCSKSTLDDDERLYSIIFRGGRVKLVGFYSPSMGVRRELGGTGGSALKWVPGPILFQFALLDKQIYIQYQPRIKNDLELIHFCSWRISFATWKGRIPGYRGRILPVVHAYPLTNYLYVWPNVSSIAA